MDQTTADRRLRVALIGLESRTQALFVYGVLALFVGLLMAAGGAPANIEAHFGPDIRIDLGAPLALGGLLVIIGSFIATEARWAWWSALAGMVTLSVWCVSMTVAYTIAGLDAGFALADPWTPIDPDRSRAYVPFLYLCLALLAGVHVVTFLRMGRPPKRLR